jgi:hypothetical protein
MVPLLQTAAAARGGGVLGNEHRMSLERSLLAVPDWFSGSETTRNQIPRVRDDRIDSAVGDVSSFA